MPLDHLQSKIFALIARNRSLSSVAAGGSVLHRHAFRLSDDTDIFHDAEHDILREAQRDISVLQSHGYAVEFSKQQVGLIEATVFSENDPPTKIQWVQSGLLNFFAPVEDHVFGWRLHYADLATNKALAAASRRELRDFVDIWLLNRKVMPLWHILWAAPGKDPSWNPSSMAQRLLRFSSFSQADLNSDVASILPLDLGKMIADIRNEIEALDDAFNTLPALTAGNLFVGVDSQIVNALEDVVSGLRTGEVRPIGPVPGGGLPTNPDIDHALIERIIDEYGFEGSKLLEP